MPSRSFPSKTLTSLLKPLLLISSLLFLLYLFVSPNRIYPPPVRILRTPLHAPAQTALHHIVFGLGSSAKAWPERKKYVKIWWKPGHARGYVFLDRIPAGTQDNDTGLPRVRISEDTARFPYTYRGGLRSAIRVARIVSEIVALDLPDVRWIVVGDDDTVFVAGNLLKVMSKYDHNEWFYVGGNSESVAQNSKYSFDMAFGGGGFAVTYALARVLDSCLARYAHLYGSDARVFVCLAELGVGLTRELGFYQVETHNQERALRKFKCHSSVIALDVSGPDIRTREQRGQSLIQQEVGELSKHHVEKTKEELEESGSCQQG